MKRPKVIAVCLLPSGSHALSIFIDSGNIMDESFALQLQPHWEALLSFHYARALVEYGAGETSTTPVCILLPGPNLPYSMYSIFCPRMQIKAPSSHEYF